MAVMGRRVSVWLVTVAAFQVTAFGDSDSGRPTTAAVCDIATQPERYSGKFVAVRGQVVIAFEDFRLSSTGCPTQSTDGVWLEYGSGPKRQPTTWCCGDMVPRDALRISRDSEFRRFHRYITAQKHTAGCRERQCYLYSVTATITGRVDTVEPGTCPNGKGLCCTSGFGHFGLSCTRIVIQRVRDVTAAPRLDAKP